MLSRAVLALVLLAAPLNAEQSDCFAAPTRECLFETVRERAEASTKAHETVRVLTQIAAWEEALGIGDPRETIATMLDLLRQKEPVAEERLWRFTYSANFSLRGHLPEVAGMLADAVAAESVSFPYKQGNITTTMYKWSVVAGLAGIAGDRDRARQAILSEEEDERLGAAKAAAEGFLRHGDVAAAMAVADLVPGDDFPRYVRERVVVHLLRQKRYEAAVAMASAIEDDAERAALLVRIAKGLAEAGRPDDAVDLVQRPVVLREMKQDVDLLDDMALVYAYAGDRQQMELLLAVRRSGLPSWSVDPEVVGAIAGNHRFIAALAEGDMGRSMAVLRVTENKAAASLMVYTVLPGFLATHPEMAETLRAAMPAEFQSDLLPVLVRHQADLGEMDKALASLARYREIEPSADSNTWIAYRLAPALARAGRPQEAVRMADESGELGLLLEVAILIERPDFAAEDFPAIIQFSQSYP